MLKFDFWIKGLEIKKCDIYNKEKIKILSKGKLIVINKMTENNVFDKKVDKEGNQNIKKNWNKKMNKRIILRVALMIIIVLNCVMIFNFSSEKSEQSNKTSGVVVDKIVDTLPKIKNLNTVEKEKAKQKIVTPVRKTAHFTAYMSLGIWIYLCSMTFMTFEEKEKNRVNDNINIEKGIECKSDVRCKSKAECGNGVKYENRVEYEKRVECENGVKGKDRTECKNVKCKNGNENMRRILISVVLAFTYACSDEIHQLFVPGRSGEFRDVCIDTCGASFGILLVWCVIRVARKLKRKNK